jgi:hypothetical protein
VPAFGPIRRGDLIRALRVAGFNGPFAGTKHEFMEKGSLRVRVPNPHEGAVARDLLGRILRQAGISRDEWEQL